MLTILDRISHWPIWTSGASRRLPRLDPRTLSDHDLADLNLPFGVRFGRDRTDFEGLHR